MICFQTSPKLDTEGYQSLVTLVGPVVGRLLQNQWQLLTFLISNKEHSKGHDYDERGYVVWGEIAIKCTSFLSLPAKGFALRLLVWWHHPWRTSLDPLKGFSRKCSLPRHQLLFSINRMEKLAVPISPSDCALSFGGRHIMPDHLTFHVSPHSQPARWRWSFLPPPSVTYLLIMKINFFTGLIEVNTFPKV